MELICEANQLTGFDISDMIYDTSFYKKCILK